MTNKNRANVINKVNELAKVNTITKALFSIVEGVTKSGFKCFGVLTDLRISNEDFKSLMHEITIAGGYGFMKFYPDHKTKLISAMGIEKGLFSDLLEQYNWTKPEPKQPKVKATSKKVSAKEAGLSNEDIELFKQFKLFKQMQGKA